MTSEVNMTTHMFVKWLEHFSQYKPPSKVRWGVITSKLHHRRGCMKKIMLFCCTYPNHTINISTFGLIFSEEWPKEASPSKIHHSRNILPTPDIEEKQITPSKNHLNYRAR
ncbi:hypothetical protein JTB14_037825 [Gonioctena quinquepunctata]|nr:hypothetical protein JTB14_037825 [Gonioctena quinquepunctata]